MSNLAYAPSRPAVRPSVRPAPQTRPSSPHGRPIASDRAEPAAWAHIEIVTTRAQRRARPKVAYAVVTVVSLFVIFGAQLLLSIVVSEGAYQIASLQSQEKDLLRTQGDLSEKFDLLSSTQHLAANAAKLGMVPNGSPLFLNLSTGAVAGAPGTVDPTGCGGACNLVANSLLTGVPLTDHATTRAQTSTATSSTAGNTKPSQSGFVNALPAPVTH